MKATINSAQLEVNIPDCKQPQLIHESLLFEFLMTCKDTIKNVLWDFKESKEIDVQTESVVCICLVKLWSLESASTEIIHWDQALKFRNCCWKWYANPNWSNLGAIVWVLSSIVWLRSWKSFYFRNRVVQLILRSAMHMYNNTKCLAKSQ